MFWKYNSPSSVQIDALLQQENVSLQDLMEEDELLQECISQNKKVIEYLTQPQTLEALVSYVVTDPSPDRELKVRFKYANLASELLTSDVPAIVEKVASSTNLLQMLYQFLEKEKPLNPLLASFVSKVFGMLVQRRSEQVLDFLKSKGDFVELAVKHIGTSAVMDLLIKLICGVDDDDQELKRGIHEWLNESHLIEQIVDKLAPDCDSEEHSSVDQLLCELIVKGQDTSSSGSDSQSNGSQSRLLKTLESKNIINKLMDTLLHEERSESSVSHVINILLTLLSYKGSFKQSNVYHSNSIDVDAELDSRDTVLRTIVGRLPDLQKILRQPPKLGSLTTAYGTEIERLGSTRLKVISLVSSLISTQDAYVHQKMASLNTLHLLFELFFKFSLNNFLHSQVAQCIPSILSKPLIGVDVLDGERINEEIDGLNNNPQNVENGEKDFIEDDKNQEAESSESIQDTANHPLLNQLFTECSIIQEILRCYAVEEESTSEKKLHNLIGYMGHIRDIANNIVQYSNEGPSCLLIQKEIKKLPNDIVTQWEEFTLIGLAEINLKNKIIPLQDKVYIPAESMVMKGVSHRDSEDDSEEEFQSIESLVIMNKGFREGDMDTLGDMPFVEEFKDAEEVLNTGAQRLSPSHMMGVSSSSEMNEVNIDDGSENNFEKFEEMCSERTADAHLFDDLWKNKEKEITFQMKEKTEEVQEENHSSSEEEGDIDDEFDNLRSSGEKMEVDFNSQVEWSDVFDKRGEAINVDPSFNPWQSAPASDTTGNNSWADFGASSYDSSVNPFDQTNNKSSNLTVFPSSNNISSGEPSKFQADFSNAFFSSPAKSNDTLGTQAAFPAFSDDPSHFKKDVSDAQSVPICTGSGSLQDVCDVTKTVPSVQPTVNQSGENLSANAFEETCFMEDKTSSFESNFTQDKKTSTFESSFDVDANEMSAEAFESNSSKFQSSDDMDEVIFEADTPQDPTSDIQQVESSSVIKNEVDSCNISREENQNASASCIIEIQSSTQNISMDDIQ